MSGQWRCNGCQQEVSPEHVTFEERHDERTGGCGASVYWEIPRPQIADTNDPRDVQISDMKMTIAALRAEIARLTSALAEKEEEAAWLRDANNLHLDQLHMKDAALTAQGERLAKAEAALRPFAHFAACFDKQPMRGIDDDVYAIHINTEWEAHLRLSDMRAARNTLRAAAQDQRGGGA